MDSVQNGSFIVVVDLSSRLDFLLLRWKTTNTAFAALSFNFQVWRCSPTVAMSLLSNPSTACQSPSACMIAGSLAYRDSGWHERGIDVEGIPGRIPAGPGHHS